MSLKTLEMAVLLRAALRRALGQSAAHHGALIWSAPNREIACLFVVLVAACCGRGRLSKDRVTSLMGQEGSGSQADDDSNPQI